MMARGTRVLLIAVIITAGAFIRMDGLTSRGVGHLEMYAPNIPLPTSLSVPPPRPTLLKTLTGSLWEVHPPAWYLLTFPWTRMVGTGPAALRFPSAVFGVLSIWLLWNLASRERSAATAMLAAGLLAVNGLHVMWSQISRPVMLASMLAVASSLLLIRTAESGRRSVLLQYLAVSLLGLATDYYYWPLFAGQMCWVLLLAADGRQLARGLLQWQFLVVILASPLITLAVAQSRPSYLATDVSGSLLRYLGFGFLLGPVESTAGVAGWPATMVMGIGCTLFVVGLLAGSTRARTDLRGNWPPPAPWLFWSTTAAATTAAVAAGYVLSAYGIGSQGKVLPTALSAPFLAATSVALMSGLRRRTWPVARGITLCSVLSVVPPGLVFVLSLVIPFIDTKYFLLFTPFLLVLLADGIVQIVSRPGSRFRWVAAVVAASWLTVAHLGSLRFFASIDATPIDHRSLASQLRPLLQDDDRVLVFRHYAMTPLFYYLPEGAAHYVGDGHVAAVLEAPESRFWVISLRDSDIEDPQAIREAIAGCQLVATLSARRIRAELYEGCLSRVGDD